jgi:hypothetical protein
MKKMTWIKGIKIKKIKPSQGMSETRFLSDPGFYRGDIDMVLGRQNMGRQNMTKDWGERLGRKQRESRQVEYRRVKMRQNETDDDDEEDATTGSQITCCSDYLSSIGKSKRTRSTT